MGKPAAPARLRLPPLSHSFTLDFVVNFQYGRDAARFQKDLADRFRKFGLELAEEKTRVMRFGRFVRSDLDDQAEADGERDQDAGL